MEINNVRANHNTNEGSYECAFCHKRFNSPVERMNHEQKCYATTKYKEEQREAEEIHSREKTDTERITKEWNQLNAEVKVMNRIDFIKQHMKRIQLKDISNYKGMPILMVIPQTIEVKNNNSTVAVFDMGYEYNWFVFNGSVPFNDKIDTTAFFVLKDWSK